jgi:hypothetical protein
MHDKADPAFHAWEYILESITIKEHFCVEKIALGDMASRPAIFFEQAPDEQTCAALGKIYCFAVTRFSVH